MIVGSKLIFSSLKGTKRALKEETKTINFAFASIVATKNIKKGQKLTKNNIFPIRPGTGDFGVKNFESLLGKNAKRDIKENYQIKKRDIN